MLLCYVVMLCYVMLLLCCYYVVQDASRLQSIYVNSGSVPAIIFLAQIAFKFVNHALIVDNRKLLLFWIENLANLLGLSGRYIPIKTVIMIKLLRNVMLTMPRELGVPVE